MDPKQPIKVWSLPIEFQKQVENPGDIRFDSVRRLRPTNPEDLERFRIENEKAYEVIKDDNVLYGIYIPLSEERDERDERKR